MGSHVTSRQVDIIAGTLAEETQQKCPPYSRYNLRPSQIILPILQRD